MQLAHHISRSNSTPLLQMEATVAGSAPAKEDGNRGVEKRFPDPGKSVGSAEFLAKQNRLKRQAARKALGFKAVQQEAPAEIQPWDKNRKKTAPNLDELFGKAVPPKPHRHTRDDGLRDSEIDPSDNRSALIHPGRISFAAYDTCSDQKAKRCRQLADTFFKLNSQLRINWRRNPIVYNWIVSENGNIYVGTDGARLDSKKKPHPTGVATKLGHPTLIGGRPRPSGRIAGELRFGLLDKGSRLPVLYIDNRSSRYNINPYRSKEHLEHVANRFRELGLPVAEVKWITG